MSSLQLLLLVLTPTRFQAALASRDNRQLIVILDRQRIRADVPELDQMLDELCSVVLSACAPNQIRLVVGCSDIVLDDVQEVFAA
jgi:hypothetical protein